MPVRGRGHGKDFVDQGELHLKVVPGHSAVQALDETNSSPPGKSFLHSQSVEGILVSPSRGIEREMEQYPLHREEGKTRQSPEDLRGEFSAVFYRASCSPPPALSQRTRQGAYELPPEVPVFAEQYPQELWGRCQKCSN